MCVYRHNDTLARMTKPEEMRRNVMKVLELLVCCLLSAIVVSISHIHRHSLAHILSDFKQVLQTRS